MRIDQLLSAIHRIIQFTGRLSLAGTQFLAVVVVAWYILHIYPGDRWMPVRMVSYFAPWVFITLIGGLLIAIMGRRRQLSGLLLVLAILYWPHMSMGSGRRTSSHCMF